MAIKNRISKGLNRYFPHIKRLRDGQEEVLAAVLQNQNTLAIMPTSSGKSLCYQLPAFLLAEKKQGFTIVISPLIALMKDQLNKVRNKGVHVTAINSSIKSQEQKEILRDIVRGNIDILFVAPERLRDELFLVALEQSSREISLCVVDEAHCISEWGHDFRGEYLYIPEFLCSHNNPQVIALTATAVQPVRQEIIRELKVEQVFDEFPVFRPNLHYSCISFSQKDNKDKYLLDLIRTLPRPGIVYTSGKEKAEKLAALLQNEGYNADYYHADRKNGKNKVFEQFMSGKIEVLCATCAFGMGVDKPDIRFIIHYQIPGSLDAYCQETGRGGRDGQDCECVLFFQKSDIATQKRFISESHPDSNTVKSIYLNELGLGPIKRITKMERDIPIGQFYENKAAILLRHFERIGLVERKGELLVEVDVDVSSGKSQQNFLVKAIKKQLGSRYSGAIRISSLAEELNITEVEAIKQVYGAAVDGILDIGSRQMRFIRYLLLRDDISQTDLEDIEAEMMKRRAFKLKRLDAIVAYANGSQNCRAIQISQYFNKVMTEPCGNCDVCIQQRFTKPENAYSDHMRSPGHDNPDEEYVSEECRWVMKFCKENNLDIPEVGYEMVGENGKVMAMGELAWPQKKVAIFLVNQAEDSCVFSQNGWKCLMTPSDIEKKYCMALLQLLKGEWRCRK